MKITDVMTRLQIHNKTRHPNPLDGNGASSRFESPRVALATNLV